MSVSTAANRRRTSWPDRERTGKHLLLKEERATPLILLVDDSADDRDMYAAFIGDAGLAVAHAVDGEHALFKVLSIQPDAIVMDLAMPVLDGFETTRSIRANPRAQHIPVVVLTANATPEVARRAREAGADAVLTKPCLPEKLLAAVRRLLAR